MFRTVILLRKMSAEIARANIKDAFFVGGAWVKPEGSFAVMSPVDGTEIAKVRSNLQLIQELEQYDVSHLQQLMSLMWSTSHRIPHILL